MEPVKVLIAFYSRGGSTLALAEAMAEGAREAGAEVVLRRVNELVSEEIIARVPGWKESRDAMRAKYAVPTADDVKSADAILFGTPTRFGSISSELKAFVDSLGGLWAQGLIANKVGGAFVSTSTIHGGNESTIISMYNFMAHFGMIIAPPGYTDPVFFAAGTPYGASSVSGAGSNIPPTEQDLLAARHQGKRTAEIATALKRGQASA